jgi:hypothetical protein
MDFVKLTASSIKGEATLWMNGLITPVPKSLPAEIAGLGIAKAPTSS